MSAPLNEAERRPDLAYYEAVPYLLVIESIERTGEWFRRAAHPELPGCMAEAPSAVEALERLEQERLRMLRTLWEGGAAIPVPRPPLRVVQALRGQLKASG
jgi:predicted RNase H-like HicB family nuclease